MSCNRQNIRPVGRPGRPNPCVTGPVVPVGAAGGFIIGNNAGTGCGAPCANVLLEELPLGMAYVPWQTYGTMYPLQQGWHRGTMFPGLDFDFMGRRCN